MMKRIWLLQLIMLAVVCNTTAQQFSIKGKTGKRADGAKVMLSYQSGGQYQYDSTLVKNGKFFFSGNISEPVKAYINLISPREPGDSSMYPKSDNAELFLEPGRITISSSDGKLSTAKIKGGPGQSDLVELQRRLKPANERLRILMDSIYKYGGEDTAMVAKIRKSSREVYAEMDKVKAGFVPDYPDSYLSLSLVKEKSAIIEEDKLLPMFNALSERMRNTATAKAIAVRLEAAKRTRIGQKALDFTQTDTAGIPVSLSSMKGKYVLVDFWASWCGPCREENPFLVKAYEKYRKKNFEIISVSLDSQKPAWTRAIREDGLPWIHVSDLKAGKNEVAKLYDIRAVPQNILVDPDGVIIAKNLRSQQLEEKLNEILGK